MLSFFSKKIVLKDLVTGLVDIHSHLLPGIDDGAKTIADTQQLLKSVQQLGFDRVITTPHTTKDVWNNTAKIIKQCEQYTKESLPELFSAMQVKVASEYMLDDGFVQLFQKKSILTLKDNYVLVEICFSSFPTHLYEILFDLQIAGYRPVLAHPERYVYLHGNFEEYHKLKKVGCEFQLNLLSTVGVYGEKITQMADKLLKEGLIDFVGSDIHNQHHINAFEKPLKIKNTQPLEEAIKNNAFFC